MVIFLLIIIVLILLMGADGFGDFVGELLGCLVNGILILTAIGLLAAVL